MIKYTHDLPGPEEYFHLFQSTGWNSSYKASSRDLIVALQNSWYLVAAYRDKSLVGFGRLVSDSVLYAMIYDMIVLPDFQGQGIGSTILDRLVEKCRDQGIRDIQLFSAKGKLDFYKNRGFEQRPQDAPGMRLV